MTESCIKFQDYKINFKWRSRRSFTLLFLFPGGFLIYEVKHTGKPIRTGAEQTEKYFSALRGKSVAVVANQTSQIAGIPLVDLCCILKSVSSKYSDPNMDSGGMRVTGALVADSLDSQTGIPGHFAVRKKSMPSREDLRMWILSCLIYRTWVPGFLLISSHCSVSCNLVQIFINHYVLDRPF